MGLLVKRLLDLFEREIPTLPILDLIANILLLVDNDGDDGCCNESEWSCWWCFGKDTVEVGVNDVGEMRVLLWCFQPLCF